MTKRRGRDRAPEQEDHRHRSARSPTARSIQATSPAAQALARERGELIRTRDAAETAWLEASEAYEAARVKDEAT